MSLSHPVKDILSVAVIIVLFVSSCHRNNDPLVGRWTVDKVNVEFDENKATPEMVRQYGEMERGNVIVISQGHEMLFIADGDTLKTKCVLEGDQLLCDGKPFACLKDGKLTTEEVTPLGKVTVSYMK